MGFLDFIKHKFLNGFNRNRRLVEGKNNINQNNVQIKVENLSTSALKNSSNLKKEEVESRFDNDIKLDYIPKPQTLDFALQQYLLGLLYQYNNEASYSSYRVLTGLSALDNRTPGINARNEEIVLDNVERNKNLNLQQQKTSSGEVTFNHVMSKERTKEPDTRVYINCKRENVAALADKFIKELGDTPFYFKFCSDKEASKTRRSEQFVFYTNSESDELDTILQTIERTKQKNPSLFDGAQSFNPFMKSVSGYIAYAPEVDDIYVGLDGKKRPISKSYNTLLSTALEDSFINTAQNISAKDYKLAEKMGGGPCSDPKVYVANVLSDIMSSPDKARELINGMKRNLEIECSRNPKLDIKGIDLSKTSQREFA